jgi:hypothetical protein
MQNSRHLYRRIRLQISVRDRHSRCFFQFTLTHAGTVCHIVARPAVSRQRLRKHVPAATDTHAAIEILLEMVCYTPWKGVIRRTIEARIGTLFLGDINTGISPQSLVESESEGVKCGHESRGTRTWEWLRWRGAAAIVTASVQLENKITGRESQGACRQDELIGGKPPVVK